MSVLGWVCYCYLATLLVQPIAKDQRSDGSKYAQNHGDGLPQPNGPWNRGAAQNDGSEKAQFNPERLLVLRAIPAEAVCHLWLMLTLYPQ